MLQAAAAFGGGFLLQREMEKVNWPKFGPLAEDSRSFKLSVRVLSAAVPAVGSPGLWSRQRPRLEVTLGETQKDTELADYVGDDNTSPLDNTHECPWRFGDTLTFTCNFKEVQDPGVVRLKLRAHSDVQLGPVMFQFSSIADLGEASVDLQRRALPACVGHQTVRDGTWESPVILVPLSHVRGGKCVEGHEVGKAVAHVAIGFSIDVDPEEILGAIAREQRPVSEQVRSWMDSPWSARTPPPEARTSPAPVKGAVDAEIIHRVSHACPTDEGSISPSRRRRQARDKQDRPPRTPERAVQSGHRSEEQASSRQATSEACRFPRTTSLLAPNLSPDGWIHCRAPNGRTFWHHKALGPPPWETDEGSENIPPERPNQDLMSELKALPTKLPSAGCKDFTSKKMTPSKPVKPIQGEADSGLAKWTHCASPKEVDLPSAQGHSALPEPDLEPEGWVSRQGPNGRTFWHHLALGPAPWQMRTTRTQVTTI